MVRSSSRRSARCVTPAKSGWADQWQKAGPAIRKKIGQDGKCPVCGNLLVKRNGKYGEFYGCKDFPRCRYARNIQGKRSAGINHN